MSKFTFVLFITLLATTLIVAAPNKATCGRHGDACISSSECCPNMRCHTYANRCQVIITAEELMAQREKILKRKGKDY